MWRQRINKTTLDNGITVLSDAMPSAHSAALGAWILRGSRHEAKAENGLSHFFEHLVFKGTRHRTPFEISSALEARGGTLDAYTTRQETGFYAIVPPDDAPLALEVISDLLMNPLFDAGDLEKERKVIIEEIKSYDDIAEEVATDLFFKAHYAGSGLSLPIAGTPSSVRKLTQADLFRFREQVISELPLLVCAAGRVNHESLVELCKRCFEGKASKPGGLRQDYEAHTGKKVVSRPELQQANFVWGTSFPFGENPGRFKNALSLFNVAFGSGMSSRLFQSIREERGLAYYVDSALDVFCGNFGFSVSLSTAKKQLETAAELAEAELRTFLKSGFRSGELERARRNILGSMAIAADNTEKRMLRLAEHTLHYGKCDPMAEVERQLLRLDENEVLEALLPAFEAAKFTTAIVQPAE